MGYFDAIQNSPSEIYHYALPFCPPSSWLHKYYSSELRQVKIVKGFQATWGVCSRTVSFDQYPGPLAHWKDMVAVGIWGGAILVDVVTGIQMSVFSGQDRRSLALTFSLDGTFLVSGSSYGFTFLWDIQTGGLIKTFQKGYHDVHSVSISMDNTKVATVNEGHEIQLWDTISGSPHPIDKHGPATSVIFSLIAPQLLMAIAVSGDVFQWNTDNHESRPISRSGLEIQHHTAAFSSDGTCFILWKEQTATVCNSDSGVVIAELQAPVPSQTTRAVWFISSDGKYVACGAECIIFVWDITGPDPHLVNTFIGHTGYITGVSFSSSLISSSDDKSIKFWKVGASPTEPVVTNRKPPPSTSSPPMAISLQAKDKVAILVDEAGAVRTWDLSTGLCKASFCTPAIFNSKKDIQLIGDRIIFVWCTSKKIHIWDTKRRKHHQTIDQISNLSTTIPRISEDGSKVFVLDHEYLQALSTQTGEMMGKVGLEGRLSDDPLTVDGSGVWVHFIDSQTKGWDFGILGSTPVPLSDAPPDPARPRLDFINGAKTPGAGPSRVEDTVTGKEVYRLTGRFAKPKIAQWDGRYLVAGYQNGEVLILDFDCMIPQ